MHVDDDPVLQEIMKLMLQDLEGSIEIDNASSVDEGLAKLAAKTYDLVVSDYDMPMKNGLDFLQQIRQNKNLTPFILFTGKGREEVAIRALNLGADGYYNKQGTPETVYGELAHGITLVTEKAKANSALEASEKRYHTLMDNAAEAIFIHDIKGKILDVNEQACKNLQYTKEELLSKSIKDISVTAENDKRLNEIWSKVLTGNTISLQSTQIRKDKSRFPVEVTLSIISFDKEKLVIALVKDITERKKAEDYLKFSKEFSESIINSVDEMLLVIDVNDFKIVDGNVAALKQTGCSKAELIGKTCFAMTHHSSFHCQPPNDICPIQAVIETGNPVTVEHVHLDENNNPRIVEVWARPVINPEGKNVIIHVAKDITEHKEAEERLELMMDQLVLVNEKLGVVGSMTRHDVRNKLSTVTGYAYLLKKKHSDQADIVEGLGKMEQAVKESMKIFDFAKMYEQIGVEELTIIDVEAKLTEATTLFSGLLPKIINECHGLTVLADSFLRQLFYNFIDNTRKYGKKTTTIRVHYEKADQDSLRLVYEDDGVGISAENKLKLFTEGFSTGGSTGFGLFLTKKMIDVYGWTIIENGELGKGAKFTITLPKLNKNGNENYQISP